jgi:hypothetical protein
MSEMSALQRTVANFVDKAGTDSSGVDLEAALDGALGRYRQRFALGSHVGSGR